MSRTEENVNFLRENYLFLINAGFIYKNKLNSDKCIHFNIFCEEVFERKKHKPL